MTLKTPQQVREMKEAERKAAIAESKRRQQRRLDAEERRFLNEFKEVWE